jgi:hypothetical protein
MSIVIFSGATFLSIFESLDISRLVVPSEFGTSSGRPFLVDFTQISTEHVFSAIFPAFFLTLLFYFDHNVSSLLSQRSEYVCLLSLTSLAFEETVSIQLGLSRHRIDPDRMRRIRNPSMQWFDPTGSNACPGVGETRKKRPASESGVFRRH